jgi:hypothetical protein
MKTYPEEINHFLKNLILFNDSEVFERTALER